MKHRSGFITAALAFALLAPLGAAHAADSAPAPKADVKAKKDEAKKDEAKCDVAPGSRIQRKKPEVCKDIAQQPYRSYSKEEIDNTGETNIAEALRKLDPSFR